MTKLKRIPSRGWAGGVCAGLEEWSGVNSILWRLAFVLLAGSFWIYLLLWIFVDEDEV